LTVAPTLYYRQCLLAQSTLRRGSCAGQLVPHPGTWQRIGGLMSEIGVPIPGPIHGVQIVPLRPLPLCSA